MVYIAHKRILHLLLIVSPILAVQNLDFCVDILHLILFKVLFILKTSMIN